MTDILTRVISESGNTFAIACNTTQLVNEACRRHDVGPLAAAALGRALTGTVLIGALLKGKQFVQLKIEGNGPLGKIITEAGPDGWCRGYVMNPHAELPLKEGQIDVAGGIGRAGLLTVTKDIGMKQRYQGTTNLVSSEIGEDIAYYLTSSEQVPSAVALGVQLNPDGTIGAAGGFLIQSLPPADEELITSMEKKISTMSPISTMLLNGLTPIEILDQLFAETPYKKTMSIPLEYTCSCNREKMEQALFSLGKTELNKLIQDQEGARVNCEFCRASYHFDSPELTKISDALGKTQ